MRNYDDWVTLYLSLDYIEVADVMDRAEAVRIGSGRGTVPRSWLDLLTNDQREQLQWREHEFRSEPDAP